MNTLWQRFLQASALIFGLALGVAATVFGYSNTATVNVGWSVLHLNGIPLWTVAVVPLVVALVLFALYHWFSNLQHFTENVRHRRRIHDLEQEMSSLRAQLDQLLEMPDHASTGMAPAAASAAAPAAANVMAEPAPKPTPADSAAVNGDGKGAKKQRTRGALPVPETETIAASNDGIEAEPREETSAEA